MDYIKNNWKKGDTVSSYRLNHMEEGIERAADKAKDVERRASEGEFTTTVLKITSSNGTVFKQDQIATVLSVAIYVGDDCIKDISSLQNKFGVNAHLIWYWQLGGENEYHIIQSTDPKISENGFKLTIATDDFVGYSTFLCELSV